MMPIAGELTVESDQPVKAYKLDEEGQGFFKEVFKADWDSQLSGGC